MTSAVAASLNSTLFQDAKAQTSNTIETFAFINVSPNPCGVGQQVTVNFWLAVPIADSELAKNMTVVVTNPAGTNTTLGPFTFRPHRWHRHLLYPNHNRQLHIPTLLRWTDTDRSPELFRRQHLCRICRTS